MKRSNLSAKSQRFYKLAIARLLSSFEFSPATDSFVPLMVALYRGGEGDNLQDLFETQLFNPDKTWAAVLCNALQNFLKYCT